MQIKIRGASEHNLKNIDLEIGNYLTVVTGLSGSGKTSLVFDTLYHEARRRLYNTISSSRPGGWRYMLSPARVESINGLGPAIAVGQNILNRNPNSILATASGLHPFLRLLYSNYGIRHCPVCGYQLSVLSIDEIVDYLAKLAGKSHIEVLAPLLRGVQGSHRTLINFLSNQFDDSKILVDGKIWQFQELDPTLPHNLEIKIAEITGLSKSKDIREIIQQVLTLGSNILIARTDASERTMVTVPICALCGNWFEKLEPKHFHMNCPYCLGEGCVTCQDTGLHPQTVGVRWSGFQLFELLQLSVSEVFNLFQNNLVSSTAERLLKEITNRLRALERVGLGYLSLDRPSPTLSRGESQRVRLALILTSRLEDILYVLDEPTIGQHPWDVARFLPTLRDLSGPVVFVEHDRVAAAQADYAIDLGPGAGFDGGEIVFEGTPAGLWEAATETGNYFSLRKRPGGSKHRPKVDQFITLSGADKHNLQSINLKIPIARMTVITGVSGSGKSTLVEHVLFPSIDQGQPQGCLSMSAPALKPVLVDQSPIGRNPRSNPATYTKLSDVIRELYAQTTGLTPSHFSFNRPEGACPTCQGMGAIEVRMQFLRSYWITCSDCEGQRFNEKVLKHRVRFGDCDYSIADFYSLPINDVAKLFSKETRLPANSHKKSLKILNALLDVGLGYMLLGQPSPTLSGGEAQRVKLTKYLGRSSIKTHLLILDEPSTGLHPSDLKGLLIILGRLVDEGATVIIVEHNTDIIRAADWIIDLGPGAGPDGGQVLYEGGLEEFLKVNHSRTANALLAEENLSPHSDCKPQIAWQPEVIRIRNARANNLKGVDVDIPKGKITVVTGLSGSGKSSLVNDVLEVEARRRYLESLSMYERQGTREGPEAPVDSVSGLGVTLSVQDILTHTWSTLSHFTRRASVGRSTEISYRLAVLLALVGERLCHDCGEKMNRDKVWVCSKCHAQQEIAKPRHFSTENYASACDTCTGVGVIYEPRPEKLIIHPEKALCSGAMYSPGYWPQSYLCQDTGIMQALGERYGFDPFKTPWREMPSQAQSAFLYGDAIPLERTYRSKASGKFVTVTAPWEGFYGGWVKDWDVHGTYTQVVNCPDCNGAGLLPEYLAVELAGYNLHELSEMPLDQLAKILELLPKKEWTQPVVGQSLRIVEKRLSFLRRVGLGYLTLNRPTGTLSAGEAQRIQLAGLLGSELTSLTVLLDEPSRGMHPSELVALIDALIELRDEGNTIIVVEHDLILIESADHIIDLGPGSGNLGGKVVGSGSIDVITLLNTFTGNWLRERKASWMTRVKLATDQGNHEIDDGECVVQENHWLEIIGARENNLKGDPIKIPHGKLVGICGVSGSGKSTLLLDTLGRALVPKTHSTSFANEPLEPGIHDSITGLPDRTVLVDQSRREIRNPAVYLGLVNPLIKLFAESPDAQAFGLDAKYLAQSCRECRGAGRLRIEMGFLPDIFTECETCRGTGYLPEAWDIRRNGISLPEVNNLTFDEVYQLVKSEQNLARKIRLVIEVGLGYLVWRQPGFTLSGGEAQRIKIVKELSRKVTKKTLYILDEPTVGQHIEDVGKVIQVLRSLVHKGHTVVLIEHHPHVLALCDWLIELGPCGGPDGGFVITSGPPNQVALSDTPTAPFIRKALDELR